MGKSKSKRREQQAGVYRKPKGTTLVPLGYSADNNRLHYCLRRYGAYVCYGFFDFVTELFYIDSEKSNLKSEDWDLLIRELHKLDYEYSGNADGYFYQKWLEVHAIFNY